LCRELCNPLPFINLHTYILCIVVTFEIPCDNVVRLVTVTPLTTHRAPSPGYKTTSPLWCSITQWSFSISTPARTVNIWRFCCQNGEFILLWSKKIYFIGTLIVVHILIHKLIVVSLVSQGFYKHTFWTDVAIHLALYNFFERRRRGGRWWLILLILVELFANTVKISSCTYKCRHKSISQLPHENCLCDICRPNMVSLAAWMWRNWFNHETWHKFSKVSRPLNEVKVKWYMPGWQVPSMIMCGPSMVSLGCMVMEKLI